MSMSLSVEFNHESVNIFASRLLVDVKSMDDGEKQTRTSASHGRS